MPGEEPYLTQEQKDIDKREQQWRDSWELKKKQMLQEKIGKDVESIRGSAGLMIKAEHFWSIRWNHVPGREGSCDSVGLCSDNFETYGPTTAPVLGGGGADAGLSLGLYANGDLMHNNKVIHTFDVDAVAATVAAALAAESPTTWSTPSPVEEKAENAPIGENISGAGCCTSGESKVDSSCDAASATITAAAASTDADASTDASKDTNTTQTVESNGDDSTAMGEKSGEKKIKSKTSKKSLRLVLIRTFNTEEI